MTFLSPLWLIAAGAGIAPVLIHLIFRRKYIRIDWAAGRFLRNALKKKKRRLVIEHLLLMALRILFLIMIAVICAVPVFKWGLFGGLGTGTGATIVMLDNSYSMGLQTGDTAVFERAKTISSLIAEQGAGQGRIVFIPLIPRGSTDSRSTFDASHVLKAVEETEITFSYPELHSAFETAGEIIDQYPGSGHSIFIITDFQKETWNFSPESLAGIHFGKAAEKADIRIVDVSQETEKTNFGIISLQVKGRAPTRGAYAEIEVLIRNYSDTAAERNVYFMLEDELYAKTRANLKPGLNPVPMRVRFANPGLTTLKVYLDDDILDGDNTRYLVVDVPPAVEILAVNGETSVEAMKDETDFFKKAMNPGGEFASVDDISIHVTDVTENEFRTKDISEYDIVVLANVMRTTPQKVRSIHSFLSHGGCLIISAGDIIDRNYYNTALFGPEKGKILPLRLEEPVYEASEGGDLQKFDLGTLKGLPLAFMKNFSDTVAEHIHFRSYFRIPEQGREDWKHTEVILRFTDGTPAAVINRAHGLVCFLNFTLDEDWTDFPSHPLYLPFMRELVNYCVKDRGRSLNRLCGEKISVDVPPDLGNREFTLTAPDGTVDRTVPSFSDFRYTVHAESTYIPGIYKVSHGRINRVRACNPGPEEGSLDHMNSEVLRDRFPHADIGHIRPGAADMFAADTFSARAGSGWKLFAVIALCLLAVEHSLAWWFSQ